MTIGDVVDVNRSLRGFDTLRSFRGVVTLIDENRLRLYVYHYGRETADNVSNFLVVGEHKECSPAAI